MLSSTMMENCSLPSKPCALRNSAVSQTNDRTQWMTIGFACILHKADLDESLGQLHRQASISSCCLRVCNDPVTKKLMSGIQKAANCIGIGPAMTTMLRRSMYDQPITMMPKNEPQRSKASSRIAHAEETTVWHQRT